MSRIKPIFLQTIKQYSMLCSGDSVTVAFSGGADSAALLVLLHDFCAEQGIALRAAHLNHALRGAESDEDEAFARDFCAARGIEFVSERAEIAEIAGQTGESIETAARRVRYAFLHRVARGGKIATAHNADDSVETVLLNLIRGSGVRGLCGIPPTNDRIIRPLIQIPSDDIRAFCAENHIPYVVDSSNLSDDYTRNRLRHHVLPVLRELNPAMATTVLRGTALARADADYLDSEAARALETVRSGAGLDANRLRDLPAAIRSRVLRGYAVQGGRMLDFQQTRAIEGLLESGAGRRQLSDGYSVEVLKGVLTLQAPCTAKPFEADFRSFYAKVDGRSIVGKICEKNKIHNLLFKNCIDYDKIGENLTLRSRKSGDVFAPAGRNCTKTIKKLFNEAAIPADRRDGVCILADANGILWVEGFGAAEHAAVKEETKTVLVLEIGDRAECEEQEA